jgi:hypothetical protein
MGGNVDLGPSRGPIAATEGLIEVLLRQAPDMPPSRTPWRTGRRFIPGATYSGVKVRQCSVEED